jgi:prepilin-type N-terminal cleavage/methylation domain-containing protein
MTRRSGFTLLEIAVALAILGIGTVSCLQIFGASLRMQSRASRESRAVMHARVAMDALLANCHPCRDRRCPPEVEDYTAECPTTAEGFSTHVLVRHATPEEGAEDRTMDLQPEVSLRYLEVDVSWQDGVGTKTYTLKSLRMAPAE